MLMQANVPVHQSASVAPARLTENAPGSLAIHVSPGFTLPLCLGDHMVFYHVIAVVSNYSNHIVNNVK